MTVTNYVHDGHKVDFGKTSHWAFPWKSYLETPPARKLLDGIGINFGGVSNTQAPHVARLLSNVGFKRVRLEVGWSTLDYNNPSQLAGNQVNAFNTKIDALRNHGIRPLLLLNANHGAPCPMIHSTVTVIDPAAIGATTIKIAVADVAKIVPGKTGVDQGGVAARQLVTAVDGGTGVCTMSRPLLASLTPGPHSFTTLLYEPFDVPSVGVLGATFAATMDGWLNYVKVVLSAVRDRLGTDDFDAEVWNEIQFGSAFLSRDAYYATKNGNGPARGEILPRTVDHVRDAANGIAGVKVGNGFANQVPWPAPGTQPLGLTAIDKHPYNDGANFTATTPQPANRWINGQYQVGASSTDWGFCPTYQPKMPEWFLNALQTEHLVHDIAPYSSLIPNSVTTGELHGRFVAGPGGPLNYWVTETGTKTVGGLDEASRIHLRAKFVLRALLAYLNKGMDAVHIFTALDDVFGVIKSTFADAIKTDPATYPGDALGGEATAAIGRLTSDLSDATTITNPRSLQLSALGDYALNKQFSGNGTAQFPDLMNRDVFTFLPFQVTNSKFAVFCYVMTRDCDQAYTGGTSPTRSDMPQELYRMTITGVNGMAVTPSGLDPMTGATVPVTVIDRQTGNVTVEMNVTDSPRRLMLDEGAVAPPDTTPPQTTITAGPSGTVTVDTISFSFASSEPSSSFEARLDGGLWTTATSPRSYSGLANGTHTFEVRATDASGNTDLTPASRNFTVAVDVTPPQTTITSGPSGQTNQTSVVFQFSSNEPGSTFEARLDAGAWVAVTPPVTYSGLHDGVHTFEARAVDPAGNVDPSPASRTFTVDTTAPETTINSGPSGTTEDPSPVFTFSSVEPGVTFEARLDTAGFAAATSPIAYSGLGLGAHTFEVRSVDAVGNRESPAVSRSFVVVAAVVASGVSGLPKLVQPD